MARNQPRPWQCNLLFSTVWLDIQVVWLYSYFESSRTEVTWRSCDQSDEALDVLQYEPMNVPPCLSTSTGEIYSGTKSTVLKPLRKLGAVAKFPLFSEVMSTLIIDLSFVVNLLGSVRAVTYGATVNRFLDTVWTYIEQLGTRYARIDIVTDRYNCVHLLKQRTRANRGGVLARSPI